MTQPTDRSTEQRFAVGDEVVWHDDFDGIVQKKLITVDGLETNRGNQYLRAPDGKYWLASKCTLIRRQPAEQPALKAAYDQAGKVYEQAREARQRQRDRDSAEFAEQPAQAGAGEKTAGHYVQLGTGQIHHTSEVPAGTVFVDVDESDRVIGVEFLADFPPLISLLHEAADQSATIAELRAAKMCEHCERYDGDELPPWVVCGQCHEAKIAKLREENKRMRDMLDSRAAEFENLQKRCTHFHDAMHAQGVKAHGFEKQIATLTAKLAEAEQRSKRARFALVLNFATEHERAEQFCRELKSIVAKWNDPSQPVQPAAGGAETTEIPPPAENCYATLESTLNEVDRCYRIMVAGGYGGLPVTAVGVSLKKLREHVEKVS